MTQKTAIHICITIYGTARFKLKACECITRMYFVTSVKYFLKSRVFVDTCTTHSCVLHAR